MGRTVNEPGLYEIRIAGHLSTTWQVRFEELCVRLDPGGETLFSCTLDRAVLHEVLIRIYNQGLISCPSTS